MAIQAKDIRNISFISHGGAGKTTLTEMFLYNSGSIEEPGNVEQGNTRSDFTPEEKEHQYSIDNSYFNFSWQDKVINLIDTPGYADFQGEVVSALRMVESSVLLIDATSGIEVNTNNVWSIAEENNLTKFIFINKMDEEEADFDQVLQDLKDNYGSNLFPLTIPAGEGKDFEGIIDVLSKKLITDENKEDVPDKFSAHLEDYRLQLIETIVELDEELMMKYLEDEEITDTELIETLEKGILEENLIPVFAGSALNNVGVKTLMDYLIDLAPGPLSESNIKGVEDEQEKDIELSEDGSLVGLVGKTMVDPYIGKLSIFRILGGSVQKGDKIYIPRINDELSISKLYTLNGSEQEETDKLASGQIGAVAKMDELETSDTLLSPELDFELEKINFPEPMLMQAATPAADSDEEKMSSALNRYSLEDPTFKVNYNKEVKELVIKGMGNIHLSVINDICQRKFDVRFETSTPSVTYKETLQKKVESEHRHKKQSGGRGQFGHVYLRVAPLPRGEGFEFEEEIFGGAIPNQYIPAVEKGVREAKEEGVLAGYPVVDLKVTVYDGDYHDVDSSEMAFKIASSKAFRKGLKRAKPVLLEPILKVKIVVPERFMGDIMGDLNSRRGKILGMEPDGNDQIINAEVPEGEMFEYTTDLKSITGGYGYFTTEFSHYDKVPGEVQQEIIERANDDD